MAKKKTMHDVNERDYAAVADRVRKIQAQDLYIPLARLFALKCQQENEDRKRTGENLVFGLDGIYEFFKILRDSNTQQIRESSFLEEAETKKLAKSLHDVKDYLRGQRPLDPSVLYHDCAYAMDKGYYHLGKVVAETILNCSEPKNLRKNLISKLLDLD